MEHRTSKLTLKFTQGPKISRYRSSVRQICSKPKVGTQPPSKETTRPTKSSWNNRWEPRQRSKSLRHTISSRPFAAMWKLRTFNQLLPHTQKWTESLKINKRASTWSQFRIHLSSTTFFSRLTTKTNGWQVKTSITSLRYLKPPFSPVWDKSPSTHAFAPSKRS